MSSTRSLVSPSTITTRLIASPKNICRQRLAILSMTPPAIYFLQPGLFAVEIERGNRIRSANGDSFSYNNRANLSRPDRGFWFNALRIRRPGSHGSL